MFDKETIIVRTPSGISTRGVVEWLGERSDADALEVQSIVYRRDAHSPDEYLTVEPGISALDLFNEPSMINPPERIVIDYLVTTGQPFNWHSGDYAERVWIGTRDEYASDLKESAKNTDDEQIDWDEFIEWDIVGGELIEGVLTGDLFKGDR